MRFEPLDVINNQFYFGIGGIGDFLLLMATFYDDIKPRTDVIFVCNNVNAIRNVSHQFPKIDKVWLYPLNAFQRTPEMWKEITDDVLCCGTGVTPKNFDYVGDWIECGKTNVFDYYDVKRNPDWAKSTSRSSHLVCIQPYGGSDDKTKLKEIPTNELKNIIDDCKRKELDVFLIGSENDKKRFSKDFPNVLTECDEIGNCVYWMIEFGACFGVIRLCTKFISCDTWGKTLAGLAGNSVIIYPNQYSTPIEQMFNHPVDPSDYVFLKDWGFTYADGRSF